VVALWIWYASLLLEAWLLIRLVRWQVQFRWFGAYLCYDWPRWITLAILDHWWASTGYYRAFWRWTEPISISLLWLMAVEAYRYISQRGEPGRVHCGLAAVGLVVIGALPGPVEGVNKYLAVRALVAGVSAVVLIVVLTGRWDIHGCILAAFCTADMIASVSVYVGAQNPRVAEFLILAQTGCLLGWLQYAPVLGRPQQRN